MDWVLLDLQKCPPCLRLFSWGSLVRHWVSWAYAPKLVMGSGGHSWIDFGSVGLWKVPPPLHSVRILWFGIACVGLATWACNSAGVPCFCIGCVGLVGSVSHALCSSQGPSFHSGRCHSTPGAVIPGSPEYTWYSQWLSFQSRSCHSSSGAHRIWPLCLIHLKSGSHLKDWYQKYCCFFWCNLVKTAPPVFWKDSHSDWQIQIILESQNTTWIWIPHWYLEPGKTI